MSRRLPPRRLVRLAFCAFLGWTCAAAYGTWWGMGTALLAVHVLCEMSDAWVWRSPEKAL